MWDDEYDAQQQIAMKDVESFLNAVKSGTRDEWGRDYFGDHYQLILHLIE